MKLLSKKQLRARVFVDGAYTRLIRLNIGEIAFIIDKSEAIDLARQLVAAVDETAGQ